MNILIVEDNQKLAQNIKTVLCHENYIVEKLVELKKMLKELYEIFPMGPAKGACKIAGLPKPDGCV